MTGKLATLVAALALAGCSNTKYGCKGMPDDPTCLSAVDAYKVTDKANTTLRPADSAAPTHAPVAGVTPPAAPAPAPKIDDPTPIRTPSRVMRIWIAPWEDADGDLNVSGYLFTEIEPRRWMIGRGTPTLEPAISEFQVTQRAKPTVQPESESGQDGDTAPR